MIPASGRPKSPLSERDLRRPPRLALPSTGTLTKGLRGLLGDGGPASVPLRVLTRAENVHTSSYQTEIVTCDLGDSEVRLLCKYSGDPEFDHAVRRLSRGQRGGVRYEIEVYREVLDSREVQSLMAGGRPGGPVTDPGQGNATFAPVAKCQRDAGHDGHIGGHA